MRFRAAKCRPSRRSSSLDRSPSHRPHSCSVLLQTGFSILWQPDQPAVRKTVFSQGAIMALESTQWPEPIAARVIALADRFAQPPRDARRLLHGEQDRVMPPALAGRRRGAVARTRGRGDAGPCSRLSDTASTRASSGARPSTWLHRRREPAARPHAPAGAIHLARIRRRQARQRCRSGRAASPTPCCATTRRRRPRLERAIDVVEDTLTGSRLAARVRRARRPPDRGRVAAGIAGT